jgi:hypothetical protein
MRARSKTSKIFGVVLIASLLLSTLGVSPAAAQNQGGEAGSTWFNLPSIPLRIDPNGAASVAGFNIGPVLPSAIVQQLQGAGIQKLEVRVGHNGILLYSNGTPLPSLSWNTDSVATLQEVIQRAPGVPNASMISGLLPWLRRIGIGVALKLSDAADELPRWTGETTFAAEPPAATVGPFQLGGVAFDESGNLRIGSVPGSALGLSGPLLDANALGLLNQLGLDKVQVKTDPTGIMLSMNDRPLPGLTYNGTALEAVKPIVSAFAPTAAPMLDTVLPLLPGLQVDAAVSFTGEPAGAMQLGTVPVVLNSDGTLTAFGVALPGGPMVPADLLQKLQQAGVQKLDVDVSQEGLFLAANGQTLPTITWTPESLNKLASIVAPLAGISSDMISGGLNLISETGGLKAAVAVGGGEALPAEINKTLQAPSTEGAPVMRLNASVQQGAIQSIEGLGNLADLGLDPIALPPNVTQILSQLGAQQIQLNTDPGQVNVLLDGATALTLNWDQASLQSVLMLATPFLAGTPLEDPNVSKLVQEQIMPLLPGSDVDVTLTLN